MVRGPIPARNPWKDKTITTLTSVMTGAYGLYSGSKAAVERMVLALAKEIGGRGVTVNAVAPGPVDDSFYRGAETPEALSHRIVDPRPDGRSAVRGPVVPTLEDCQAQLRRGHGVWFAPRQMAQWALCPGVALVPIADIAPTPSRSCGRSPLLEISSTP